MPFMYGTTQAASKVNRELRFLSETVCMELVSAYCHAIYADRSASLTGFDVERIIYMVQHYISQTHHTALDAVGSVLDAEFMQHGA